MHHFCAEKKDMHFQYKDSEALTLHTHKKINNLH